MIFQQATRFKTSAAADDEYGNYRYDAFIAKLNATGTSLLYATGTSLLYATGTSLLYATGTSLLYATYMSGRKHDGAQDIAVDAAGDAFVGGMTQSGDFPTAQPSLEFGDTSQSYE